MKKLLKISLVLFATTLFSQDFAGRVEYQTIRNEKNRINEEETEDSEKVNKKIGFTKEQMNVFEKAIKEAHQKKYVLTFNKNEALFEQIQELEKPKPESGQVTFIVELGGEGNKYINTKEKISLIEEDMYDDELLIKDSLQKIDWAITEETKKISDYNCLKATYINPISKSEQESYDRYLKKIEKGEKPLFEVKKPKTTTTIAWYTPEIPVSFGPKNTWGLPGLIMQLEDFNLVYLCTKVEIKKNVNNKIKIPKKGKVVTKKEFEKIEAKMQKRMEEEEEIIFSK